MNAPARPPISAPPGIRGHLRADELAWIDFDPSELVDLAAVQAADHPELATQLAGCTRAAWQCVAYVRFRDRADQNRVSESVILESDSEDFVVDIDETGRPVGVELLGIASAHQHDHE